MLKKIIIASMVFCAFTSLVARADEYSEGWQAECKKDAMTDKVSCTISQDESRVFMYFSSGSKPDTVCILYNDFPGREGAIRVDANKAVKTVHEGCVTGEPLFSQMRHGKTIKTQYYKWPDDYTQNASGNLSGLNAAIAQLPELRKHPISE